MFGNSEPEPKQDKIKTLPDNFDHNIFRLAKLKVFMYEVYLPCKGTRGEEPLQKVYNPNVFQAFKKKKQMDTENPAYEHLRFVKNCNRRTVLSSRLHFIFLPIYD